MAQEKECILQTIRIIQQTTELFYRQKQEEGFQKMQDTVAAITQMVDKLHQYKEEHENFAYDELVVVKSLTEAMDAIEAGDTVLLADILEYDFVEYLQEAIESME